MHTSGRRRSPRRWSGWLPLIVLALAALACGRAGQPAAPTATLNLTYSLPPSSTVSPAAPTPTNREPALTPTATATATVTPSPIPSASPTATPPPHVVIISIDGLRADAAETANMPNLHALAARGAYTYQAQTTFPPVTLPSHASMLSGVGPDVHGILWNDYQPDRGFITVPTIFSVAHAAGFVTVIVAGKEKFQHFNAPGTVDRYTFVTTGDQGVADQAIAEVAAGFGVLFVHFPNTDFFGHSTGWMSDTYLFQLSRTDDALGRLLAALPPDTVVIVSADHGGHGLTHGANIPVDMTIPWIIAGPGVRENYLLTQPVTTTDTAVTAAYVLGLTFPDPVSGRAVLEAFSAPLPVASATP